MAGSWPKVIRDPVHELIPFEDNPCDRLLWDLINTKEFQRLRRIKQLGVCELVFPGADHSRFAHSIGVMHIARSFLARIRRVRPELLNQEKETLVLAASLIHDVGHGPFSHSFESITGDRHESRTLEIILDASTEIHQCLASYQPCGELPRKISLFFDESIENDRITEAEVPSFLTQIVSSQLDADRFDYLQRDSHATGADYGQFDWKWLIHHLDLDHEKGRFYLNRKALAEAERYVFARYHMYRTVYFHKTSRAAEVMLRLIFKRFKQLVENAGSALDVQTLFPGAPGSVLAAFSGKPPLAVYLALDDHAMTELFKAFTRGQDPLLRELGEGLLNRKLYKAVDVTFASPRAAADFKVAAIDKIRSLGLDPAFALVDDSPSDTPYKPYDPDAEKPVNQIYVEGPTGGWQEISQASRSIETLQKEYSLLRYYFPGRIREVIVSIAAKHLKPGA
jgi:HD superfamily phosphohydrolase